jgi:hypothetical protein
MRKPRTALRSSMPQSMLCASASMRPER